MLLKYFFIFTTLITLSQCNVVNVSRINTAPINLITVLYDTDGVELHEYVCAGGMQVNILNKDELLLGICSPPALRLSGVIGTLPLSCLQGEYCDGNSSAVKVEYGNLTADKPPTDTTGTDWDGTYLNAVISTPEHIYQVADIVYFVDARSCVRKVNRISGNVTTIRGKCYNGTLGISGVVDQLIYGMTYFEEKEMWVVAILNKGIYVFSEETEPRLLVPRDEMSHSVSDAVRQIIRGVDSANQHNDIVWHKVKEGVNFYDLSEVNATTGNLTYNDTFVRYISASGTDTIDKTARRANQSDPMLGASDAALSVSPDGSVLLIADTTLDKLFFLDIVDEEGDGGNIDPLQEVCEKNESAIIDDPIENCTFSAITAALWIDNDTILVYERIHSSFLSVTLLLPSPTTTTDPEDTTTPGTSSASAPTITLYICTVLTMLILL